MGVSNFERITAFENRFARAQATDVVDLSWGFAVLQADFPLSQYHNRIAVTSVASAADVLAAAEEVLGGACVRHRYVSVDNDPLGQALRAGFEAAGYGHETVVTMIYSGPEVEPAAHEVRAVSLETVRPAIMRDWRVALPDATDEALGQLADRTALYARGLNQPCLAIRRHQNSPVCPSHQERASPVEREPARNLRREDADGICELLAGGELNLGLRRWKEAAKNRVMSVDPGRSAEWGGSSGGLRTAHLWRFEPRQSGGVHITSIAVFHGSSIGVLKPFVAMRWQRLFQAQVEGLVDMADKGC